MTQYLQTVFETVDIVTIMCNIYTQILNLTHKQASFTLQYTHHVWLTLCFIF